MTRFCPCGAEAVVVSGATRLCVAHMMGLDPAELYRLERDRSAIRNAPKRGRDLARIRRVIASIEAPDTSGVLNLHRFGRRGRGPSIAVGRRLHG